MFEQFIYSSMTLSTHPNATVFPDVQAFSRPLFSITNIHMFT
jgi:hypothetical protein